MEKAFEMSKEIARINLEKNIPVQVLIEEYKKAHNSTDQSKSYEHNKTFNDSITE